MIYSDAWGKMIHEKNQKSKISWHCPFKYVQYIKHELAPNHNLSSTHNLSYTVLIISKSISYKSWQKPLLISQPYVTQDESDIFIFY